MTRLILILLISAALIVPAAADAHRHHHHHHRGRAAWVVEGGCEAASEPSWTEWRAEMLEAGFSQPETEELEFCGR